MKIIIKKFREQAKIFSGVMYWKGQRVTLHFLPTQHPLHAYIGELATITNIPNVPESYNAYIHVDSNPKITGFPDGINGVNKGFGAYVGLEYLIPVSCG